MPHDQSTITDNAPSSESASSGTAAAPPRSVLIVDDEPAVGAALTVRLQAVGFSSRCATSGAQGLTEARRSKPGAIILDVRMPEMDGIEMCTILRADPVISDIPVVFLSASTLTPGTLRTLHALGDAFLAKPYDAPELLRILESFMPTPANLGLAPTRKRHARPNLLDNAVVSTNTTTTESSDVPAFLAPTGRTAVATGDSGEAPESPVEISLCQPSAPEGQRKGQAETPLLGSHDRPEVQSTTTHNTAAPMPQHFTTKPTTT